MKVEADRRTYFFSEGGFSGRGFAAARGAKADALSVHGQDANGADLWNGIAGQDASAPQYHRVPLDTVLPGDAVCVDINAAYPTALANLGIVQAKTFGNLMKLPKKDRLKAVGMLGTTRHVQRFAAGELVSMNVEREPTASAFFATCAHVGDVMQVAAEQSGAAFGFFWVDGIFVRPEAADVVCDVLRGASFDFTREAVRNIRRSDSGRFIFYTKNDKPTYLCVPRRISFDGAELVKKLRAC